MRIWYWFSALSLVGLLATSNAAKADTIVLPGSSFQTNHALLGTATQSSTLGPDFAAENAVDGFVSGFSHNTGAANDLNPWWQVEFNAGDQDISEVVLYDRTDCNLAGNPCAGRFSDLTVVIRDAADTVDLLVSPVLNLGNIDNDPETIVWDVKAANGGSVLNGGIVRVERNGFPTAPVYLGLGEVKALDDDLSPGVLVRDSNLALGRVATQSSTALGATADRAIDGDTNGDWNNSTSISVTDATSTPNEWWMVDLGTTSEIDGVSVYSRTDFGGSLLVGSVVEVLADDGSTVVASSALPTSGVVSGTSSAGPEILAVDFTGGSTVQGRYVRVQGLPETLLQLAEVEVYGESPTTGVKLTIDRSTGSMTLRNDLLSGVDILGYSITSEVGALDQAGWTPIAGNYDSNGNMAIDDEAWQILTAGDSHTDLSETLFEKNPGDGGVLAPGVDYDLGASAWIQNLSEDVQMQLLLANGDVVELAVQFTGGPSGAAFEFGDLNFDGVFDQDDFTEVFAPSYLTDTSEMSPAQKYQAGDFNEDGVTNFADFRFYNNAYLAANPGAAAFSFQAVPEPSSVVLLGLGCVALGFGRFGKRQSQSSASSAVVLPGRGAALAVLAMLLAFALDNQEANAQLSVANGDFEAQSATVGDGFLLVGFDTNDDLDSWFTSTTPSLGLFGSGFGTGTQLPIPPGDLVMIVVESEGYFYQNLGTPSADTKAITVGFDYMERDIQFEGVDRPSASVRLELFSGTFSGAKGVDIADTLTAVTSADIAPSDVFSTPSTIGPGDPEGPFTVTRTFENVAFAPGEDVWLRVSSPDAVSTLAGANAHFDNITVAESTVSSLVLQVNKTTGATAIVNQSGEVTEIDSYVISSPLSSLNPGVWTSLESQEFDSPPGEPVWTELGSVATEISEGYFGGTSLLGDETSISLGDIYSGASNEDLVFEFVERPGDILQSTPIQYVEESVGDMDGNGVLNGVDINLFVMALTDRTAYDTLYPTLDADVIGNVNADGAFNLGDVAGFKLLFGSGSGGATSVPEPSSAVLFCLALLGVINGCRRKRMVS